MHRRFHHGLLGGVFVVLNACGTPAPIAVVPTPSSVAASPPTSVPLIATLRPAAQPTMTPTRTATAGPQTAFFTHPSRDPIVAHGNSSSWDAAYTDPGAVVFQNGMFHMFRNGFRAWPATVQIGYVTSPDGYTWTKQGTDPVLRTDQVSYAGTAALASSVLVQDDGTWVLYLYTWDATTTPTSGTIGRAVALQPAGPWQPDATPLLRPGAKGEWDEQQLIAPDVIHAADGYRMYYSAFNSQGVEMIGMATSTDGITWTKYNDPATRAAPFADSDPVLQPGKAGTWEAAVSQPRVFQTANGWVMFYRGNPPRQAGKMGLGYATSADGIHWTRFSHNPVLMAKDIKQLNFWFTDLLYHDNTVFLFWEVENKGHTDIHLAIHRGAVEP
jgi:hypothetical protein